MSRDQNRLADIHIVRNELTRGDWESFLPHRKRVTELILGAAHAEHRSLCILGAGNGNDLDLSLLAQRYEKITLVDLDREALAHCLARQPASVASRIETIAGVDLSGLLAPLDDQDQNPEQIEKLISRAHRPNAAGLATYDVVASTCLLTQMIDSVVSAVGADHPRFANLVVSLRDGHLKLLGDLTAGGGTALLITDFVSSDTLPQLTTVRDADLESLLVRAINEGNFFTGVNPAVLADRFGRESGRGARGSIGRPLPWRWQLGNRTYGVCALALSKEGSR